MILVRGAQVAPRQDIGGHSAFDGVISEISDSDRCRRRPCAVRDVSALYDQILQGFWVVGQRFIAVLGDDKTVADLGAECVDGH